MYLTHFGLSHKPFENTTDPRFFWFNEAFAEAHAALQYGLQEDKGFMLVTGDSGSGKTALIHAFIETIDPGISVAIIPDPDMETVDFYNYLVMELGLQQNFANKGEFLIFFKRYLQESVLLTGGKLLIVIDEAQRASNRLLADVRLLDSLGVDNKIGVNIILAGQPALIDTLADPENAALKSRLSVDIRIEPLSAPDTNKYIQYRIETAGAAGKIFTPPAIDRIFQCSQGNPLQINNLCDRTLLTAYTIGGRFIGPETVNEFAGELGIALDTNTTAISDEAQSFDFEKQTASGNNVAVNAQRPVRLVLIALIGALLLILLQIRITSSTEPQKAILKDHAVSTFDRYQQQFQKSR